MTEASDLQYTLNDILTLIAEKMDVDIEGLSPDADLYAVGLDSITLMSLVAHWRAAGYDVNFALLSRKPTVHNWVSLFHEKNQRLTHHSSSMSETVPVGQTEKPFALAPMQYAYWIGRSPEQPLGGVSAHLYAEFQITQKYGYLNPSRLSQALQLLTDRHSSLRLKATTDGCQIHRLSAKAAPLQINDLSTQATYDAEQQLEAWRQKFSSQILDVEAGEVLAIALSQLPNGDSRLHLDVDMMAADAVSYRILLRELAMLYENPGIALPKLPISYGDYRRQSEKRWPDVEKNAGEWWKNRLSRMPEGPKLPLKTYNYVRKPKTIRRYFHFDAELRNRLYHQSRRHSLTPATVLATVLAETLAGWSQDPHFLINVPLFLRPMDGPDLSGVVGDFSSSVMLEVNLSRVENFVKRARQVQSRLHEDASYAEYNGVQVLRDLGRLKGRQVISPIVFTSALNLGELFEPVVRRTFGDPIWIISQGPQVLLDTQVTEVDGGLLLNWDCREDAFIEGVLDSMFKFFQSSVLALANDSQVWLRCLADRLPPGRVQAESSTDERVVYQQPAVKPTNAIEKAVASVWTEVIGDSGDNINLNLFAAGGDSVLATSLIAKLREIFGVESIDLKALFNAPSIAGLVHSLVAASGFNHIYQIATIYCEIIELDDEAILAELEEANL